MLGAGAAELQATIKLELDWVKCPAISGISHCQVIKWDQDTCSSASVLDPWQRRSDLLSWLHDGDKSGDAFLVRVLSL